MLQVVKQVVLLVPVIAAFPIIVSTIISAACTCLFLVNGLLACLPAGALTFATVFMRSWMLMLMARASL